jgi:Ca2+-binding RTX toxin-like protein
LPTLETRCVPAVAASLQGTALTVNIDNNSASHQNVKIFSVNGTLVVRAWGNGREVDVNYGRPIASSAVRSITVNGSRLKNHIDLFAVNRTNFTRLDGRVTVNAGAGNDTIFGSAFNDTLNGGGDNDFVSGFDGDDTVNGDAGDDTVSGGAGNDTVSGGAGRDQIYGGITVPQVTDTYRDVFVVDGSDQIFQYDPRYDIKRNG